MPAPRFSILLPTRDRPATLRYALDTVLSQPGDDYDVVVADNCGTPETKHVVDAYASSRLQYTRSDEVLPMAENWERGLALCTGEYVTVLGDDDGFLPSTLAMARKVADLSRADIFSWHPHLYWWPDTIVHWNRNLLVVKMDTGAKDMDSRSILEQFYRGEVSFGYIPMIYSSFFHRDVIDEARRQFGGFFVPTAAAPDVSSGILGMHLTDTFVHSARPLSVRGTSGKSNGTALWVRSLGAEQREIYFREERLGLQKMIHDSLVPSPNLQIFLASTQLKCKELYFPLDNGITVDLHRVLRTVIGDLNFDPEAYDDNLRDALALAQKLGVQINPAEIPARQAVERKLDWGPAVADGSLRFITVNCELAGVHDIVGAARLVDAILPPVDHYLERNALPVAISSQTIKHTP